MPSPAVELVMSERDVVESLVPVVVRVVVELAVFVTVVAIDPDGLL